jgi:hypothetical protein
MKKAFISFLALILVSNLLIAQENKEKRNFGKIGITYSSFGDIGIVQGQELIGGPGYTGDNFYEIGISYLKPINRFLDFETGLGYSRYSIIITPAPYPGVKYDTEPAHLSLISIPVGLRLNFLRFFFLNGGLTLDTDVSTKNNMNNQSGIGTNLGLGLKFDFDFGLSLFVNPYFNAHSMVSLSANDLHQRLFVNGYRFGMTYQLNKRQTKNKL